MASAAMLTSVKNALGVTGSSMDNMLTVYIDAVTRYMAGAGCSDADIAASAGIVARGVSDIWTNTAGDAKFSELFTQMTAQLALTGGA